MDEDIRQIASRIRELREIAGVSAETLARELGIPLETYRRYEAGGADMPVGFLIQVAERFAVELTAILTGDEPRLHRYCLVRKGRGVAVQRREAYNYEDLAYNFVDKRAEVFLVTVEPSAPDEPVSFNAHEGQEFNYLLQGRMKVIIGSHELVLEAGDSLYFDCSLPHGMKALGAEPARFIALVV